MTAHPDPERQADRPETVQDHLSPTTITGFMSSAGIGLLGLGLGALAAAYLIGVAALLALLGLTVHLIAIIAAAKSRRERASPPPRWLRALYWISWLILASLVLVLIVTGVT